MNMKSLKIIVTLVLSSLSSMSGRSQDPPPAPIPIPAAAEEEPDQRELTRALAEVQRRLEVELGPKLEAAAARADAQVQAAQRQVERQLAKVQQAIELAQADPAAAGAAATPPAPAKPAPAPRFQQRLAQIVSRAHGSPGRTLVIRTSDTDPKVQANLEEDMAVMSRIFDKALEQKLSEDHRHRAMGIDLFFTPGSSPLRSLYLEGYGALFLMSVNFPLLPPPAKPEATREKSDTDSAWEEAKREIHGRSDAWSQFGDTFKFSPSPGPEQEYEEGKVEDLKEGLLETLKNATNIRNLKSDETIAVCVFGGASAGPRKAKATTAKLKKVGPDGPDEPVEVAVADS